MKPFPYYQQLYQKDCGPTCLRMIAQFYGKTFSSRQMKNISRIRHKGTTLLGISEAAEKLGFITSGRKINLEILREISLPIILHWNQNHFVVLFEIEKATYQVADPAQGILKLSESEFLNHWQTADHSEGVVLIIQLSPSF
ncbi:cysteine peptidase family C39 domain-containing protein [Pedobacter sp. L105]|uniref:cysteine peptidase family C39 domain-containing protein n=1 Tax=Pedobacter sp. L105 TaxID=1641871 RepID=UPI00131E1043|nr:cysteine peptidase family C39 domain-containing protein [Pedobacter sp. L105]